MDWSYLAKELGQATAEELDLSAAMGRTMAQAPVAAAQADDPQVPPAVYGGDLMAFPGPNSPARTVSDSGVGNYLNYGIRNLVADGPTLYLGMANPMNLRTDPTDAVPEGGWELIRLSSIGS
jgi:hypothetical protein